jgi:cold shock CspA family protein
MGRSRETFNKKEREKKKLKKKKDKEQKKEERKTNSDKGKGMEEMFAYVDDHGNIVSTPPDPRRRQEVKVEDIQISISKKEDPDPADLIRRGVVTFFNDQKGYGFIQDLESQASIFFHVSDLEDEVKERDKVTFETEKGLKGLNAVRVKLST